jgi:hypothetical protein
VTTRTTKIFGNGANQPQTSRERRKKGLDGARSIKAGFIKANKKLIIEKKSVNWFGGKKMFFVSPQRSASAVSARIRARARRSHTSE